MKRLTILFCTLMDFLFLFAQSSTHASTNVPQVCGNVYQADTKAGALSYELHFFENGELESKIIGFGLSKTSKGVYEQNNDNLKMTLITGGEEYNTIVLSDNTFKLVGNNNVTVSFVCVSTKSSDEYVGSEDLIAKGQNYMYLRNHIKAVECYQKAAEQGDGEAQFYLGECYYDGIGVPKNYTEAAKLFQKAAEQGYAEAQNNLGECYYKGNGVTKDYTEAVKWFQKAAEQEQVDAQCYLGLCYEYGRGVHVNYTEAVKWYRKAAEEGDVTAEYRLGVCYEYGRGVRKDWSEAAEWYRKAAEEGDDDAIDALKRINKLDDAIDALNKKNREFL